MKASAHIAGLAVRTAAALLVIGTALAAPPAALAKEAPPLSADAQKRDAALRRAMARIPATIDVSPLPDMQGDFVSQGADGAWRRPGGSSMFLYSQMMGGSEAAPQDCSRESIIAYARAAPSAFDPGKKGLLYGVQTHTPETRIATKYWDMPGFNSCALVVYAILKKAGCGWARYTANAKEIYDMAHKAGWQPTDTQEGGCMVAWNSKWGGTRARIGDRQKQSPRGSTRFRHVGITTGTWLSVDNSSWLSRPTTFFTIRPISYEPPIFLCPPTPKPLEKPENVNAR
jgi:hypothetical protein